MKLMFACLGALLLACLPPRAQAGSLIDPAPSAGTRALYDHLQAIKGRHTLFGHHDGVSYGVKWEAETGRSDAKDVTGSYPALIGWDLEGLGFEKGGDAARMGRMRAGIADVYRRGGVNTISWHMRNPVSGGKYDDKTPAVKAILPGGARHAFFKLQLDAFAAFNDTLRVDGAPVPIIFRPWHEHNGEWFWWGKGNASEAEYVALWRFTVDYLRKEKGAHNLIIAISPDRSRIKLPSFERDYLYGYPGDAYVDIMGLDDYWDLGRIENKAPAAHQVAELSATLANLADIANARHKLAALTETGEEGVPRANFWTEVLLRGMTANDKTRQMTYVMLWRNAINGGEKGNHFYVPYKGQASAADFVKFKQSDYVLFEDEMPVDYKSGK